MTRIASTCPICGGVVPHDTDRMDGGLIEEEEIKCSRCGYWYYYFYGQTEVRVGEQTWEFGYEETVANQQVRCKISSAIKEAKALWAAKGD